MIERATSRERKGPIQRRTYEIWEREGPPEFRAEVHWRKAEAELESAGPDVNPGESDKKGALAFDGIQTEFAQRADVTGHVAAARDGTGKPEGAGLRRAEEEGRLRSHGEDALQSPIPSKSSGKGI